MYGKFQPQKLCDIHKGALPDYSQKLLVRPFFVKETYFPTMIWYFWPAIKRYVALFGVRTVSVNK